MTGTWTPVAGTPVEGPPPGPPRLDPSAQRARGGTPPPSAGTGTQTPLTGEPVMMQIVSSREIDAEELTERLGRLRGVTDASVDASSGAVSFSFRGTLEDLPGIERALATRQARAYLISPARVTLDVRPVQETAADDALVTGIMNQCQPRRAKVDHGILEVWVNLDAVCVCRLAATAAGLGYEARPRSHVDVNVRLAGEGDFDGLLRGLRALETVVRVKPSDDRRCVGILAAGRLRDRDVERAVEAAGFRMESIEGM